MKHAATYLQAYGLINALGDSRAAVAPRLFAGDTSGMVLASDCVPGRTFRVGRVATPLPELDAAWAAHRSRTNQLLLAAYQQIAPEIESALRRWGRARLGVVVGTSNAGIEEATRAIAAAGVGQPVGAPTDLDFRYPQQELGSPALFLASYLGLQGPAYCLSTACTSSAKVFAAGARLLRFGLCDAVLVGGADGLAQLTLAGFHALESTAEALTNPMSRNRCGINIGEGAALFLMTRTPGPFALLGSGESSDAHHISAPHPQGAGAILAMRSALDQAGLTPEDVGYLNLHGTATPKNDAMEAQAVATVLGQVVSASSTKPLTGHLLGAAGATELALCCLAIEHNRLPPHVWDAEADPSLPPLTLATSQQTFPSGRRRVAMSNSFAFGGNNASLLVGEVA